MSLKSFEVSGLFGLYDHKISFNKQDGIDILLGQNGIGKTTILKLIFMFFNHQISRLKSIRFDHAKLLFEDEQYIEIHGVYTEGKEFVDYDITHNGENDHTQCSLIQTKAREELKRLREYTDMYYRVDDETFINRDNGLSMCEEETVFAIISNLPFSWVSSIYPDWLRDLVLQENVYFIKAQRLFTQISADISPRYSRRFATDYANTVNLIAQNISRDITKLQQTYTEKSIELDESYPYRLVESFNNESISKAIRSKQEMDIQKLTLHRQRLINAGLLNKTKFEEKKFINRSLSSYAYKAISLYIEDSESKFAIFDTELYKIELFLSLMNSIFLDKQLLVSREKGLSVLLKNSDKDLSVECLSSGEQNLLILYYDLIFKYKEGSLLLIDEPEISLHVAWQKKFIPELKKIIRCNKLQILIATHSPSLIGRYWGLTQELDKDL